MKIFFFRKIGNLLNWLTLSYTYAMPERITPQLEPSSQHEKQFHQTLLFQQWTMVPKRCFKYPRVLSPPRSSMRAAPLINSNWNVGSSFSHVLVIITASVRDQIDSTVRLQRLCCKASLLPPLSFNIFQKFENYSSEMVKHSLIMVEGNIEICCSEMTKKAYELS